MQSKYSALTKNNSWYLVSPPHGARIVGCHWVYKAKYKPDDSIYIFKSYLVAQGFTETPAIEYFDTFGPVVKPCTIRLVLTLATSFHWPIL